MLEIGEIKYGKDIGKKNPFTKFIWQACSKCGKERWVTFRKGKPDYILCHQCGIKNGKHPRGSECSWWKGRKKANGYILVKLPSDSPFFPMANGSHYVFEHRLVMAKELGRCLLKGEQVHHRPDVAKDDNRAEVLYLMPNSSDHSRFNPCSNCELKKEIRLLRWQVKELSVKAQGLIGAIPGIRIYEEPTIRVTPATEQRREVHEIEGGKVE